MQRRSLAKGLLFASVCLASLTTVESIRWPSLWSMRWGDQQQTVKALAGASAGAVVWGCNTLNRGVALTFDDGPSDATGVLLDHLKELGIKATFFVCGVNVQLRPDIVRRAFDEGHEIGLHTWSHQNLTRLQVEQNIAALEHELWDTEAAVMAVTGVKPRLYRPPYGAVTPELVNILGARGYTTVMWNGGCIDWWVNNMTIATPYIVGGMAGARTRHETLQAGFLNALERMNTVLT